MSSKTEEARQALERIRAATNRGAPADPGDLEVLVNYMSRAETAVLGAIDLLRASQNAFRSKQVARAREILEGIS